MPKTPFQRKHAAAAASAAASPVAPGYPISGFTTFTAPPLPADFRPFCGFRSCSARHTPYPQPHGEDRFPPARARTSGCESCIKRTGISMNALCSNCGLYPAPRRYARVRIFGAIMWMNVMAHAHWIRSRVCYKLPHMYLNNGVLAEADREAIKALCALISNLCFPIAFNQDCPELGWLQLHKAGARKRIQERIILSKLTKAAYPFKIPALLSYLMTFETKLITYHRALPAATIVEIPSLTDAQ